MLSVIFAATLMLNDAQITAPAIGDPASTMESAELEALGNAARSWLVLVDDSDWGASFVEAGASFREFNTVTSWREASLAARVPLGAMKSREFITAEYMNAPPKGYVAVRFRTVFENQKDAIENVTLEKDGDVLRVVGYVIE